MVTTLENNIKQFDELRVRSWCHGHAVELNQLSHTKCTIA